MAYYMLGARGSEKFTTCKKHSSCSQVLDCLDCPTSLHIVLVAYTGFLVARAGACGWSKRVGFLLSLKACLTTYFIERYKHRMFKVHNKNVAFVYPRCGTICQAVRSRKTFFPYYSFLFFLCIVCNSPPVSYECSGMKWQLKA